LHDVNDTRTFGVEEICPKLDPEAERDGNPEVGTDKGVKEATLGFWYETAAVKEPPNLENVTAADNKLPTPADTLTTTVVSDIQRVFSFTV